MQIPAQEPLLDQELPQQTEIRPELDRPVQDEVIQAAELPAQQPELEGKLPHPVRLNSQRLFFLIILLAVGSHEGTPTVLYMSRCSPSTLVRPRLAGLLFQNTEDVLV